VAQKPEAYGCCRGGDADAFDARAVRPYFAIFFAKPAREMADATSIGCTMSVIGHRTVDVDFVAGP
jgi:hypothetical protein